MNLHEYLKNKINSMKAGTYFADYYQQASDTLFLNSLKYSFEKIKNTSDETRESLKQNHQAGIEVLTPSEFANLTSSNGVSMLQLASSKLNSEAVKLLIENGADVNYRAEFGLTKNYTPLAWALGNNGSIEILTEETADEYKYDSSYNAKPKSYNYSLVNFDDFKKTVDVLLENGALALGNDKMNITQNQKEKNSAENVNMFLSQVLNGQQRFYSRVDENGERTNIHNVDRAEVVRYVMSKPELAKDISPAIISIAKRNDIDSFVEIMETIEETERPALLNKIHEVEAYELAETYQKLYKDVQMVKSLERTITENGGDIKNPANDFTGMAYREYQQKVDDLSAEYNQMSEGHSVLTQYDSKDTFNFNYPPYYMFRYVNDGVCDLNDYKQCAIDYFLENNNDAYKTIESYANDVRVAVPAFSKEENLDALADYIQPFKETLKIINEKNNEFEANKELKM